MPRPSYHTPVPKIVCFNRAKTPLGVNLDVLIRVMQKFVDQHLAPVWGTPAKLVKSRGFVKGAWAIVFVDTCKDATTEGFHDITPEGLPMARIFVKNVLDQNDVVSVTASHELAEMLVDPLTNLYAVGPQKNHFYDYEVADPVEELFFKIDGVEVSNFVYPAYFETFHRQGSMRFDHMNTLRRPFEMHKGGYQAYWYRGKERTKWGSDAKKRRFRKEDRAGHRTDVRHKSEKKLSEGPPNRTVQQVKSRAAAGGR